MGSAATTLPNITILNTAPVVENISFAGNPSITLSEAVPTEGMAFSFLAMDSDGDDEFNNNSAVLNISKDGSGWHNVTAICTAVTGGSNATAQNYSCTTEALNYWDLAGSWTCAAEIKDATDFGGKEVVNCFTVGTTTAINVTSNTLAWSSLGVGEMDSMMSTSELNVTNTGNQNLTSITLEAINLIGETTNTVWIPAANFTAPWGERSCNTGTAMVNDTATTITGSRLDFGPGSLVTTNNATHICLEEVGQDISQQAYSTSDAIEDWTITGVAA